MYTKLLSILRKHVYNISYIEPTKTSCGKLYVNTEIYKELFSFINMFSNKDKTTLLCEVCKYYNMQNGDIIIQYEKKCKKLLFMFIDMNNKTYIIAPDYSIEPTIAVFCDVSYNDNFPLNYWNI